MPVVRSAVLALGVLGSLSAGLAAADPPATQPATQPASVLQANRDRAGLADYSSGQVGLLGPLVWGRALDLGEDARFANADGTPNLAGDFLWCFQFSRASRKGDPRGLNGAFLHARNNFVARDPALGFILQPARFLLSSPGSHNAKVAIGYVPADFRFTHGDNADLEHLADAPRLVLFLPVRHAGHPRDPADQSIYYINPHYGAQTPSILAFRPGEMIEYEWFRDPKNLDPHILFDLAPHIALGEQAVRPGVTQPLVQFDLLDEPGGWQARIERDGRDGLAGGERDGDWDLVFTHRSPGARPHDLPLTPANSAWALSVFSPGGSPTDTSEVLLGLRPYDRATGAARPWPPRTPRIRTADPARLPPPPASRPAP